MTTFNRIEQTVYTKLDNLQFNSSGVSLTHTVGVGEESDSSVQNFQPIVEQYVHIEQEHVFGIFYKPFTPDEQKLSPVDVLLNRAYKWLKDNQRIVV